MSARFLSLALGLSLAPGLAGAAELVGARFLSIGKDAAVLRVELSEPAAAGVSWGEEPGAWTQSSRSAAAADVHELRMPGLSPDRRYFYQVEIDGTPLPDMSTFVSGRSWVTRKATLVATAAVPAASPEDAALAERLFAREADALVLLGGEGDPETLRAVHGRALADRLVLAGADAPSAQLAIADVALAWAGAGDLVAEAAASGSCWKVALGGDAPTADVVLARGESSSLKREGERLIVTLAGRDSAALAFASGTLTATLTSADATRQETVTRECKAPAPATREAPVEDWELEESSVDAGGHGAECDLP